jgi:hypothetical protein
MYLKSEKPSIRKGVIDFLGKVQQGKVKISTVARVKAVETKLLLGLDEEKRREVFDEVPQGNLPPVFQE